MYNINYYNYCIKILRSLRVDIKIRKIYYGRTFTSQLCYKLIVKKFKLIQLNFIGLKFLIRLSDTDIRILCRFVKCYRERGKIFNHRGSRDEKNEKKKFVQLFNYASRYGYSVWIACPLLISTLSLRQ